MVSRLMSAFSVLSVFFAVAMTASAQDSLAWKFESGESLKYVVQQSTQMVMNADGKQNTMNMEQTMDMVWKVTSAAGNGGFKMSQSVERVQVKTEGGAFGVVQFDSNSKEPVTSPVVKSMAESFRKIVGQEFAVTMQPTGKVTEVVVPEDLLKALTDSVQNSNVINEDTLKQMMSQSPVTFPGQPLKKGESWESSQKVELPFGTMTVVSNLVYEGTEDGVARISQSPRIEVLPREGAEITMTMKKSEGKGLVLFDVARGRITKSDLDLKLDLEVKRLNNAVQQSMRQKTSMVLAE